MIQPRQMKEVVEENFERYAGNVILDRAICDVRDMLKPSARMLIYSQMNITKNTANKPFIKSARVVGDCLGHLYEHGDGSCYDQYVRMSKPFAMRVPLEDFQGENGTMAKNGDHAAMRYTELRLSKLSEYLYNGLNKNAIGNAWKNNFDETEQYPGVMPSIGYFNICNGTQGLGIAISSSIPQFNLKEVNAAIIKLIQNPNASDKDIIIMPDFATGASLINAAEVYESLKVGTGAACKLRATIDYLPDEHTLVVREVPYGVYTEHITEYLKQQVINDSNYGIKDIKDSTGKTPEIYIELENGVNAQKMITKLYKETDLESYFTINMWVLENGRFPKIMGLREIFMNYIAHIRACKTREVQFDLDKYLARLNIIEGLLIAAANIDDIVALIRSSQNPSEASDKLIARYNFNDEQVKAILAMKLAALTKIDGIKLETEREEVKQNISNCRHLLNESTALDNELIKILREVADKFGDARRTKITNQVPAEEIVENIEEKQVGVMIFNNNSIMVVPQEDLPESKRGKKGAKLKLPRGVELVNTFYTTNLSSIAVFSDKGKVYSCSLTDLEFNTNYSLYDLIVLDANEKIILVNDASTFYAYKNLVTISRAGYIKKTATKEYNIRNKKGIVAVKLAEGDQLVAAHLSSSDDDRIMVASSAGYGAFYSLHEVSETGRATRGVKALKLSETDTVISSTIVRDAMRYTGILVIANNGRGKIVPLEEFVETSRAVRGQVLNHEKESSLSTIYAVPEEKTQLFLSTNNNKGTLLQVSDIPISGRNTVGILLIDCRSNLSTIQVM